MFNLQGGELIIIAVLALVVLGPERLPDAMRRLGRALGQLRRMGNEVTEEFRSAVAEPMDDLRSAVVDPARDLHDVARGTAESVRDGMTDPTDLSTPAPGDGTGERPGANDRDATDDGDAAPDRDDVGPGGTQ
ncbi:MAG: Sec-independent protein translocase protein TatB [Ilumatobacteraceae bacterium]|nr:twin-arginine translocase subunit TatB [Actinomycetota bacterium]